MLTLLPSIHNICHIKLSHLLSNLIIALTDYLVYNMDPDQTAGALLSGFSVCFYGEGFLRVHLNICSRYNKQTKFYDKKWMC